MHPQPLSFQQAITACRVETPQLYVCTSQKQHTCFTKAKIIHWCSKNICQFNAYGYTKPLMMFQRTYKPMVNIFKYWSIEAHECQNRAWAACEFDKWTEVWSSKKKKSTSITCPLPYVLAYLISTYCKLNSLILQCSPLMQHKINWLYASNNDDLISSLYLGICKKMQNKLYTSLLSPKCNKLNEQLFCFEKPIPLHE